MRVLGIQPEWLEQFGMVLASPSLEQLEITLRKALIGLLILCVERVHKTVPEGIGIDIERGMDEVRDIGPEDIVAFIGDDRIAQ
ncbi:hypothetical protein D3C85_1619730 [compost metagenome]